MLRINKKNIKEKSICIALCMLLCYSQIKITWSNVVQKLVGYTSGLDIIFFNILFGLFILLSLKKIYKAINREEIIFIFVLFIVMTISGFMEVFEVEMAREVYTDTLFRCIPGFLIANAIDDMNLLKKYLGIFSIILNVSLCMNIWVFRAQELTTGMYSQYLAYQFLIPAIISVVFFVEKFSIIHFVNWSVSEVMILGCGARGALFCSIFMLIVYVIFRTKNKWQLKVTSICILGAIGILISNNMMSIITWLMRTFSKWNVSVRVLNKIATASFFQDNARRSLVQYSMEILSERGFFGVGVLNDRVLLKNCISPGDAAIGWYPHNIFIELLLQFGLLIGLVLIFILLSSLYKIVKKNEDENFVLVGYIFIGIGIFPLLFSGSYIESTEFFMLLGFCFNYYARRKRGRNESCQINKEP